MSVLPVGMGSSGVDVGDIGHSLRLRAAASAYLSKTITTDATSTYFIACKRGKLGAISPLFDTNIKFNANDTLTAFGLTTTAVFRDPTSWLFIHISNGGLYVNGASHGAVTTSAITNPRIGYDGTNYFDGYIARCGVVGGASSAYTNFGYFNSDINEWVSKSQSQVLAVVEAGGANSFMLDFDDATSLTTLGYDKSTKNNDWTLTNVSLTAGVTYDHMLDVPGNSYATLNPVDADAYGTGTPTWSSGNLNWTSSGVGATPEISRSSMAISTGKWYWEDKIGAETGNFPGVGILSADAAINVSGSSFGPSVSTSIAYEADGQKCVAGVRSAYGSNPANGDIIGVALDCDSNQVTFYLNNVSQGVISIPSGTRYAPAFSSYGGTTHETNFGQRPFAYTPPTGYLALCQANLPEAGTVTVSGSFTGNAAADGPFVWMNGVPLTLTINSNAVTFGTHADKTAGGFKLRTASASYNTTGSNTWTATITSDVKNLFKYRNAQGN